MTHLPATTSESLDKSSAAPVGKGQKLLTRLLWGGMIVAMLGVVVGKALFPNRDVPVLFPAASYSLIDQNGKNLSDIDLHGKTYICDFIFTSCGASCPLMTHHMAELQKRLPSKIQFVSFTVNPEFDTPPVLKEYAKQYGADESRWHFLTGSPKQMAAVAQNFRMTAIPKTDTDPILHSDRFLLVDGDGNVRGVYDSNDPQKVQELIDDAKFAAHKHGGRW